MRIPRIFLSQQLVINTEIELDQNSCRHIVQVLRLKPGHPLLLFNGQGGEYQAELTLVEKRKTCAKITAYDPVERESPLNLHLAIGISKGDRMDYAIQKAVETGVNEITPLLTEYCAVALSAQRMQKRHAHWQGIIHSACEQSGRNRIPKLNPAMHFEQFCSTHQQELKLILDPAAKETLGTIQSPHPASCTLCIGPEGGLSHSETEFAQQQGFVSVRMGRRILRTETAAVVSVSALQLLWGDLG